MGNSLPVDENTFTERPGPQCHLPGREHLYLNHTVPDLAVAKTGAQVDSTVVGEQGLHFLLKKASLLPRSVWPAKAVERPDTHPGLISGGKKNLNAYFVTGTYTLADIVAQNRVQLPNENFFWYLMNFLVATGTELEAQMEYHPDLSPYAISVTRNGDLMLSNPYMNTNYAQNMLEVGQAQLGKTASYRAVLPKSGKSNRGHQGCGQIRKSKGDFGFK